MFILPLNGQAGPAEGRQWLLGQIQQDGSLNTEATLATAFQATTESVETFRIQPDAEPGDLSGVAAYLAAAAPDQSAENLARRLIASHALGLDFNADRQALMARQRAYSGFGAFPGYDADAVSTAFALRALHRLGVTQEPAAYSLQYLLDSQLDSGGWALDGENAQVQTTALAMHALWLYRNQYQVAAALDAAQSFLLGERDGDLWADTEQSALALIALLSRAVDRSPMNRRYRLWRTVRTRPGISMAMSTPPRWLFGYWRWDRFLRGISPGSLAGWWTRKPASPWRMAG
ncbi:hypothetical protein HML84_20195 [Alcanivorax sp. IO_7]|nr:hypothetical protein HML84_20195 [Alcanivorax sp. IO_7]